MPIIEPNTLARMKDDDVRMDAITTPLYCIAKFVTVDAPVPCLTLPPPLALLLLLASEVIVAVLDKS
jgi:hypothetical protein